MASSLRERKKDARRTNLLSIAEALFRKNGYSKTSIEQIASEADVGVATVYNYFGTKFAMLRAMLQPEIQRVKKETAEVFSNIPSAPLEGVLALSRCFFVGPEWRDSELFEPFVTDYFLSRKEKPNTFQDIDELRVEAFKKLFKHYKALGSIDTNMNEDDAIYVISGMFHLHLRDLYQQGQSTVTSQANLERHIKFVLTTNIDK